MGSMARAARSGSRRSGRRSVREVCLVSASGVVAGDRVVLGGRTYEVVGAPGAYLHLRPASAAGAASGVGR